MAEAAEKLWSVPEFLAWEDTRAERWELIDGRPRMMVGGTVNHHRIKGNAFLALSRALEDTRCEVFNDGPRLELESLVAYPDVVVTCDPPAPTDHAVKAPKVLIEVLSPSTQHIDRSAKWLAYQTIPSLLHHLMVAPDQPRVDLYTRREDRWDYVVISGLDQAIVLDGIEVTLTMTELYRRCFPETGAA